MTTLFISDLHLCDQQPQITKSFLQFCESKARFARALYILGDFFEYWLGDDAIDKTAQIAQKAISNLTASGIEVFFMAGNRDFLLGQQFADACGMKLLEEPYSLNLRGEEILLIHGDAECIDDQPYQQVRSMLRNPEWQQQFLTMPIEKRIEFAQQARIKSQEHTQNTSTEIMDVNSTAIDELFLIHKVSTIIHGHTHRPAIHQLGKKRRIVLGDWHHQTSFLQFDPSSGFSLYCQ